MPLARRALEISPDCADAYVVLAQETARTPDEAIELYRQGVAAGERALGEEYFAGDEDGPPFWGAVETRPYMRARYGLAGALLRAGHHAEAIGHYWALLRLNPTDNQGARDELLGALLLIGDRDGARKLLDRYGDDPMSGWAYGRALLQFQLEGESRESRRLLREALSRNPFVPAYLLGATPLPEELPDYMGLGDENEAVVRAQQQKAAWEATPGALDWLERNLPTTPNELPQASPPGFLRGLLGR